MRRFLVILLILAVAGGVVWYFVVRPKQQAATGSVGGFRSFFSLGDSSTTPEQADETSNGEDTVQATAPNDPFQKVSVGAIAGFTAYTETRTVTTPSADPKQKPVTQVVTDHVVRYVSRANGYVYEIRNDGVITQITNIFIPNIYEASFADNNQTVIVRFLRDDNQTIATYSVPIPGQNPDGTRTQKEGTYLPDNIRSLAVSLDGKALLRLTTDQTNAYVTTSDAKGGVAKELIRSPFHEWLVSWGSQPYVQTKASTAASGYLYRVDPAAKRLVKVIGSVAGLTTSISPKGTYVLYSESLPNNFTTKLFSTKTGSARNLDISILPEKCVWLQTEDAICAGNDTVPDGQYPDDWYQGTVSFSDKLYKVYAVGGLIDTLGNGSTNAFDMINLSYDGSQNRLYFIDKKTGLLWRYSL
jgi:hypothetical protein